MENLEIEASLVNPESLERQVRSETSGSQEVLELQDYPVQ